MSTSHFVTAPFDTPLERRCTKDKKEKSLQEKDRGKEGEGACFFRPIQGFFFDFLVIFTIFGFPVPFKIIISV